MTTQPTNRLIVLPFLRSRGGPVRSGSAFPLRARARVSAPAGVRSRSRAYAWLAAALQVIAPASLAALSAAPSIGASALISSAIAPASAHDVVPPPVTITMGHAGDLYIDHNNPCTDGPRATYVPFLVTNTSASTVTDLTATISGFNASITLGGGQGATQYIGALAAGETRYVYWFVSYGCTINVSASLAVAVSNAALETTSANFTLTTREAISAAAGGDVSASTLGPGAIAGQIIPLDVTFEFGGYSNGNTFHLQPAGNQSFNAGCFQLVGSLILSSSVNAIPAGTVNRIYFTAIANQGGSKIPVSVRFYFRYNCTAVNTAAKPYAMQHDNGGRKYSGNYDDAADNPPEPFPPGSDPAATFTTALSVTPSDTFGGASLRYRAVIRNTSTFAATIDSMLVTLPAGVSYDSIVSGSQVTVANAGSTPAAGATGTIRFRGVPRPPNSTPAASFAIAAGDSLILLFRATAPATPGFFTATTTSYAGTAALPSAQTTFRMRPLVNLGVTLTGPATPVAGDTVVLVRTLTNTGLHAADTLSSSVTLPADFALVSVTGAAVLTGSTLNWPTRYDLTVGATVVDSIRVRFDQLGARTATASVSTTTSRDTAQGNNSATLNMVVGAPPVVVTPDGLGTPARRLAGTGYSQRFVVASQFRRVESFDLFVRARAPIAFLALDSVIVNGVRVASFDSVRGPIAARDSVIVRVWYTVPLGSQVQDIIDVRARSITYPAASADTGWAEVRRVRPQLSLVRSFSAPTVLPGTVVTYQLSLGNPGEHAATGVVLEDSLGSELEFELGSVSSTLPAGVSAAVSYSQDGGVTWSYTPASGACGAAGGFDACVTAIRWQFTGDFAAGAPSGAGLLQYRARVP